MKTWIRFNLPVLHDIMDSDPIFFWGGTLALAVFAFVFTSALAPVISWASSIIAGK